MERGGKRRWMQRREGEWLWERDMDFRIGSTSGSGQGLAWMAIVCARRDSNTVSRLLLFGEINRIHRRLLCDCFSGGPPSKIHLLFLPPASFASTVYVPSKIAAIRWSRARVDISIIISTRVVFQRQQCKIFFCLSKAIENMLPVICPVFH